MCATLCNKAVMVLIESLDQNISKAIKDQLQFASMASRSGENKSTTGRLKARITGLIIDYLTI